MNVGYVRLSRDDDHKNYVSIENQKLIIQQYVSDRGSSIDRWYEDDGISGYIFERPGFQKMMADLDRDIDTIYVKDFSRLGRHNAKVLLLLDAFQEHGKRLIAIDDNYDSIDSNDDIIGIKTWFNERYLKDTSKKIRRAITARQKEGTLITQPPFGYRRNKLDKTILEIIPKEAETIQLIYELYLSGYGYRKIANHLTDQGISTPSMVRHERELEEGRITKRTPAARWTDSMVKDLLNNDFYIGTLRLKKRARNTVHGKDKRIPKNEQYIFENHHPEIIDQATFSLVQKIKTERNRTNYRGNHGQPADSELPSAFGSCLFCKDCGKRLTPIRRKTSVRERKYYVCSTYNTKGKSYCSKAHLIEEEDLMEDVLHYIKMYRNIFCEEIATYDFSDYESEKESIEIKRHELHTAIMKCENQLKTLLTQKVKDMALAVGNEELIHKTYISIQQSLLIQIDTLKIQSKKLDEIDAAASKINGTYKNALDILDRILTEGKLDRRDIEILIDRIIVDEHGIPEIIFKQGFPKEAHFDFADEINRQENTIIAVIMLLIAEDEREYTSAKYLSEHLCALGLDKTKRALLPYIELMKERNILCSTENVSKPYRIMKSKTDIMTIIQQFLSDLPDGITAKQLSNEYLHCALPDRWHASDGI